MAAVTTLGDSAQPVVAAAYVLGYVEGARFREVITVAHTCAALRRDLPIHVTAVRARLHPPLYSLSYMHVAP